MKYLMGRSKRKSNMFAFPQIGWWAAVIVGSAFFFALGYLVQDDYYY